jgi:MFS family permease
MKGNGERAAVLRGGFLTLFWVAQAVSLFGDRLNNFSLVALVNRFSEDPSLLLSGIYAAMYLPVLLLAPAAGVIVDRFSKKWILAATDLSRGLLVMLIPTAFSSTGSFLPVMAVVFLVSTGNLLFIPAKSGLLPEIVPHDKLVKINSILWIAGIVGVVGGFLGGGLIFDYFSWPACFYLDGATYIFSAALLALIALGLPRREGDGRFRRKPLRQSVLLDFRRSAADGLAEIRRNGRLKGPLGIQALIFFGAGGFSVLAIVFVRNASASGGSMGLAAAGLAAGAGMAAGSALAHRLGRDMGWKAECLLFLLLIPAAAAVAMSRSIITVCGGLFTAGLAATPLFIISESHLQERITPELRGRVFSLREILTRSLFLVSSFLMSFMGRVMDKGILLVALGFFLAISGVAWTGIRSSVRAYHDN